MSEAHEISVGSVVRLKSGGPHMTVIAAVGKPPVYVCIWFSESNEAQQMSFPPEALKRETWENRM